MLKVLTKLSRYN